MNLQEVATEDRNLAILYRYSEYLAVKVETGVRTKYTFSVPEEDAKILLENYADPHCAVELRSWMEALKSIEAMEAASRARMGCWTSAAYVKGYVPKRYRTNGC